MKKNVQKTGFPFGITIFILVISLLVSAGISSAYFYFTSRKGIEDITMDTEKYSRTLAEAFAEVAELAYRSRQYKRLYSLFQEKIQANIIDEAFFVKDDGNIIVHSSRERSEELKGNILTEEFYYNIDLILYPIRKKSRDVFFRDYQFAGKPVPYKRDIRKLLKEYIYPRIDVRGWLVNRAVYARGKSVGTVNFLISKDGIYSLIETTYREAVYILVGMSVASLLFSIITGLFIHARYRQIARRFMRATPVQADDTEPELDVFIMPEDPAVEDMAERPSTVPVVYEERTEKPESHGIKDAIPVATVKR